MKRRIWLTGVATLTLLSLVGCGQSSKQNGNHQTQQPKEPMHDMAE